MKIESAGGTHIGKIRDNNEDNYYINGIYKVDMTASMAAAEDAEMREQYVYAVCDGMGGESLGELASLIAVETLAERNPLQLEEELTEYVEEANSLICEEIMKNGGKRIGTTLALLLLKEGKAVICNIGDSRIYRYRGEELEQLSRDHTRVQQMLDAGIISKETAGTHRQKHVLTQHFGIFPEEFVLEPSMEYGIELQDGDIFLLCSDGLTDMLEDNQIRGIIETYEKETPKIIVCELMRGVLDAGGKDNTTIIIVKVLQ